MNVNELTSAWSSRAETALVRLQEAILSDDAQKANKWAITAGIATDKLLVLSGKPTSIVANLHEIRYTLPQLAERLGRVYARREPKEFAEVTLTPS